MAALEQFSGAETLLEQPDTVLYRGLEEMGTGLLCINERYRDPVCVVIYSR